MQRGGRCALLFLLLVDTDLEDNGTLQLNDAGRGIATQKCAEDAGRRVDGAGDGAEGD